MPLPSVLLHDHLDGGLRTETVVELSAELGYDGLPSRNATELARWFDQSDSGSLERYLEVFDHTAAVMQTAGSIERVAYEAAIDLANDGVKYAEIRFCPMLHLARGLDPSGVIESVATGLDRGRHETGLEWGLIIDSLRHLHDSMEMAKLAVAHTDLGVVGFDLAGPEADYPPQDHKDGFIYADDHGLGITVHAGEAGLDRGVEYMRVALDVLNAQRIGHGIEIIDDCVVEDGEITRLGDTAQWIKTEAVPLEMCPASNMATKAQTPAEHPFGPLFRAGFNVTLNTDNRLMSNTSMTREYDFAIEHAGLEPAALVEIARRSLRAAFCAEETKERLWQTKIAPEFVDAGLPVTNNWSP